jgi:hypothetical protein
MTPATTDRLPVLTDVIDDDGVSAPSIFPLSLSARGRDTTLATTPAPEALASQREGLAPQTVEPAPMRGVLSAEATAELVQAQLDAALPRLQEWLRADLAQRLNQELEPRIHALLEIRIAMLARDLALELRPWIDELAQETMAHVLDEGLGA